MHGEQIQNESISQDGPRVGGMRSVVLLSNYRTTQSLENWKIFKSKVKTTKQSFFDIKI